MPTYEDTDQNRPSTESHDIGTTLLDILPIPHTTQPGSDPEKHELATTINDEPTLSHALATDDYEDKGLAQQEHDEEVIDLGWNEKKHDIPAPLVGGLGNEDLWLLIRRFNKVISYLPIH